MAAIGLLDHIVGDDVDLGAIYLLPIISSAYSPGRAPAFLTAGAASLVWFANAHLIRTTPVSAALLAWAGLSQLAIYLTVAYLITLVRSGQVDIGRDATTDHLTGLSNERSLGNALAIEIARTERHGRRLAVLVMDCDGLEKVDDALGHGAGDRLLGRVAKIIIENVRQGDVAARLGGDEFAVLLPECDVPAAKEIAERILTDVRTLFARADPHGTSRVTTTISAGLACYPNAGTTASELLAAADRALHRAKQVGRDRVELASDAR